MRGVHRWGPREWKRRKDLEMPRRPTRRTASGAAQFAADPNSKPRSFLRRFLMINDPTDRGRRSGLKDARPLPVPATPRYEDTEVGFPSRRTPSRGGGTGGAGATAAGKQPPAPRSRNRPPRLGETLRLGRGRPRGSRGETGRRVSVGRQVRRPWTWL